MEAVLRVRNLVTRFTTGRGTLRAVDGVSFDVVPGQTLAVVGESGSGKSAMALSIMGLISEPGSVEAGEIWLGDTELRGLSKAAMRKLRGSRLAMVFQEPMTSLNPVYTIGWQITEAIRTHRKVRKEDARARVLELLKDVGIPSPAERVNAYPHQLSGGMLQRVMIAMALSCDPDVLIADEPTTALDVTIQAQVLALLARLRQERGMALVFITHDLGVVDEFADNVLVMYAGQVVESATVNELFNEPSHPYTQGLLKSVLRRPEPKEVNAQTVIRRLPTIPGVVPSLLELPRGCRFAPRCQLRRVPAVESDRCDERAPVLSEASKGPGEHLVRCYYSELAAGGCAVPLG